MKSYRVFQECKPSLMLIKMAVVIPFNIAFPKQIRLLQFSL